MRKNKFFKRRIRPRLRLQRRRRGRRLSMPFNPARLKDLFYKLCVWGFILIAAVIAWRVITPGIKIKASAETVAALRVPHRAITRLEAYAVRHGIPFAELFLLFCAENNFFPEKNVNYDLSGLERQYVQDFYAIKRKYDTKSIAPYIAMFENIFDELKAFPIPAGWEADDVPSFMYGDNWHAAHQGTDIIDRENIRGRIPVVSMTDGIVQDAGYSDALGYHAGIVTVHGNYYLYAHFDSLDAGIFPGAAVFSGQSLGRMGNSGSAGSHMPVHLHVGISPIAGFTKNRLWLNPYPLLRYIENPPPF
jgi:murein DD-endopeptidase MepM/ murein hydrolase activator NlpD